ncbi:MAG: DNA polymerase IV [Treponema sp.]|nr:DNA polymerase IV [Treponema sp.]
MSELKHWYLHVDLDAFFASVEMLDHPEYRGKPLIVGGLPDEKRSVVSTASYEARKYGVHSAMPTSMAYRLCPNGIFVHGRMKRYSELSYQIMNIFKNYSPDVEQMSIDEAFVDLTGTEKLFGPPEETARKLKKDVYEQSGLTVSIGLAPTKYLAKIASGLSKPDGFYMIRHGEEESFMLNLPLDKVWGLGSKSLELLHKKAIFSTRDIYNLPYENLEFMFGKNMASFLYDAVRGIEKESFNKKAKSHSISAERTFLEDITDSYTAETQLLEMAQGVMFRLLKEKAISKTVMIKLRYNDFSTFTVQESQDSPISTIDSLYEIAKRLLAKKYSEGRGIRLLGIGFENVSKERGPQQQALFEDKKEEKKQKLEQAILKMKIKNPDIKIQKARTLKALFLAGLLGASFFNSKNILWAEESLTKSGAGTTLPQTLEVPEQEDSGSLFEWDISDSNHVNFTITGFWQGEVTGGALASWSKNLPLTLSANSPVFKQEVELSADIMLNNHWYFYGAFADSFKTNTLTMGYKGEGFVRSVKLSNRNITMDSLYSANYFGFGVSGGQNQAPGLSAAFKSPDDRHSFDALIRYDVTSSKSAVFYGMNSVNDTKIDISNFIYGRYFTFPEEALDALSDIKNVYIEDSSGSYSDKNGKHYKKASASDYTIILNKNALVFSEAAASGKKTDGSIPTILLTFSSSSSVSTITSATGSYEDSSSFAGKIQELFNQASKQYQLSDYSYSLESEIDGDKALVIQNSYGFSPYLRANLYDCGLISDADLSVIYKSSQATNSRFTAIEYDPSNIISYEDFFQEEKLYATISDSQNLDSFYPFAESIPEIYLNLSYECDLQLRVRSYTSLSSLFIGTKAVAGTVQVYKNGNLETASYDPSSGNVEITSSISDTDIITILWQEEDSDFSSGAIAAGIGYNFAITPNLITDISVTSRIPLTFAGTIATMETLQQGFAALSAGIEYKDEKLTLTEKAAAAIQKANATNQLLVCAQADTEAQTYYLTSSSGYEIQALPQNLPLELEEEGNGTINSFTGISDQDITGYKIPLNWDFSEIDSSSDLIPWAAVDIKLEAGSLLKNSDQLEFALQADLSELEDTSNCKLYLQLGVQASNQKNGEDPNLPYWEIDDFDFSSKEWQLVKIELTDKDRARLISRYDARFIITGNSDLEGKIYIGPYEPVTQAIYTSQDQNISVNTASIARSTKDFSSRISWSTTEEAQDLNDTKITAVSYFTAADFSLYKSIDFNFAIKEIQSEESSSQSEDEALTFILDADSISADQDGDLALKITINDYSDLLSSSLLYHTLSVDLLNEKLYLDSIEMDQANYSLFIDKSVIPSRQKLVIDLISGDKFYSSADFYLDNLIYSGNDINYSAQNYLAGEYKSGELVTFGEKAIVKDAFIKVGSLQSFNQNGLSVKSDGAAGITIADIALETDISAKGLDFYKAGHKIESKSPLFSLFSIKENYRYNSEDESLSKEDSAQIDFSSIKLPLKIKGNANAQKNQDYARQTANLELSTNIPIKKAEIAFESKASTEEKLTTLQDTSLSQIENYFISWADISALQFTSGSANASKRKSLWNNKLSAKLPLATSGISLNPSLQYNLEALYTSSSETAFTDTSSLQFSLPLSFGIHKISLDLERNAEGYKLYDSSQGSYITDTEEFFSLQKDRSWFYQQAPFYDLFDKNLPEKITADYTSKYQASYSRKLFNSINDLWVPSAANLIVSRNIEKEDSTSQLYQFKATISNMALNNFGSQGRLHLLKWFKQDEIYSSLNAIVKLPPDLLENISFQLDYYIQALLYISDKAYLTSALELSFETDGSWLTRGTFIYTRPSNDCLSYLIGRLIFPSLTQKNPGIIRKNSLNIDISKSSSAFNQQFDFTHSAELNFLKYFTINTGIGCSYTRISTSSSTSNNLSLTASIGAKAEF